MNFVHTIKHCIRTYRPAYAKQKGCLDKKGTCKRHSISARSSHKCIKCDCSEDARQDHAAVQQCAGGAVEAAVQRLPRLVQRSVPATPPYQGDTRLYPPAHSDGDSKLDNQRRKCQEWSSRKGTRGIFHTFFDGFPNPKIRKLDFIVQSTIYHQSFAHEQWHLWYYGIIKHLTFLEQILDSQKKNKILNMKIL